MIIPKIVKLDQITLVEKHVHGDEPHRRVAPALPIEPVHLPIARQPSTAAEPSRSQLPLARQIRPEGLPHRIRVLEDILGLPTDPPAAPTGLHPRLQRLETVWNGAVGAGGMPDRLQTLEDGLGDSASGTEELEKRLQSLEVAVHGDKARAAMMERLAELELLLGVTAGSSRASLQQRLEQLEEISGVSCTSTGTRNAPPAATPAITAATSSATSPSTTHAPSLLVPPTLATPTPSPPISRDPLSAHDIIEMRNVMRKYFPGTMNQLDRGLSSRNPSIIQTSVRQELQRLRPSQAQGNPRAGSSFATGSSGKSQTSGSRGSAAFASM